MAGPSDELAELVRSFEETVEIGPLESYYHYLVIAERLGRSSLLEMVKVYFSFGYGVPSHYLDKLGLSEKEAAALRIACMPESHRELRDAAERGDVRAMTQLGKKLVTGKGYAEDKPKGLHLLREAARMGGPGEKLLYAIFHAGYGYEVATSRSDISVEAKEMLLQASRAFEERGDVGVSTALELSDAMRVYGLPSLGDKWRQVAAEKGDLSSIYEEAWDLLRRGKRQSGAAAAAALRKALSMFDRASELGHHKSAVEARRMRAAHQCVHASPDAYREYLRRARHTDPYASIQFAKHFALSWDDIEAAIRDLTGVATSESSPYWCEAAHELAQLWKRMGRLKKVRTNCHRCRCDQCKYDGGRIDLYGSAGKKREEEGVFILGYLARDQEGQLSDAARRDLAAWVRRGRGDAKQLDAARKHLRLAGEPEQALGGVAGGGGRGGGEGVGPL